MRRVFDLDVLACPGGGGRLRLIATVEDPAVVGKILAHLGSTRRTLPSVIRPSLGVGLCPCGPRQDAS